MDATKFTHPLDPANGRYLCSPSHPMPANAPPESRWSHTNLVSVGEQQSGWPSGDTQGYRCNDCGHEFEVELPQ